MSVHGYSSPMVCELAGVAPSTLNYWVSTDVVSPSLRGQAGRRATQWWALNDVIAVRTVKALRDAGCPLQTLRRAQAVIWNAVGQDIGDAVLYWDGVDLLRVSEFGEVESLVRHPGQQVLHLVAIPIERWRNEIGEFAVDVDIERLERRDQERAKRKSIPWLSAAS